MFCALLTSFFLTLPQEVRASAHLKVGDPLSSVREAKQLLRRAPTEGHFMMLIQALAATGSTAEMMKSWKEFYARFPKEACASSVLEELSWAILREGMQAHTLQTRLFAIIGAALTQDAYATQFLLEGMRDSNAHIRTISIELATLFRDAPLQEEMVRLFPLERNRQVKLALIKAVGELKIEALSPLLIDLLEKKSSAEEKRAAISALCHFQEKLEEKELRRLLQDGRAQLRLLACEKLATLGQIEGGELLFPLFQDPHPEVAAAALRAVGLMGMTFDEKKLRHLTKNSDPHVAIAASWLLLLQNPLAGEEAFTSWIFHERARVRAEAAGAIASAGKYGVGAAIRFLEETQDPFVKLNLAFGLIGQREHTLQSAEILSKLLAQQEEKWMREEGLFPYIQKSTLGHLPQIADYPELVNQTLRLEAINLLAIVRYPGAEKAIRQFLQKRNYAVTGLAAETLLGEGDETAISCVKELLYDADKEICLDAALVLATWAEDPEAIPVLLHLYGEVDRKTKIKILEGLSRVGDQSVVGFLTECLQEPSLNLRLVAASVLLQVLNH